MTLIQKANEIKEELNQFQDEFLKYSFIVELSAYVSPKQEDIMLDKYLHEGCQSRVWIKLQEKGGCLDIRATSDTMVIRGILYILMELYNGVSLSEIAESHLDFLEVCGLADSFTSDRADGIRSINKRIIQYSSTYHTSP